MPATGAPPFEAGAQDIDGGREGGMLTDGATANPDGALPPPACSQGLFCSGFEVPMLDDWDQALAVNGTAERSSDVVRAGNGALAATTSAPSGVALMLKGGLGPFSSEEVYVRAYYYVPSSEPRVNFALLTVGDASVAVTGGVSVLVSADGFALAAETGSVVRAGTLPVPLDRWFCLELELQLDRRGRATLWLDGAEENALPGVDTLCPKS